MSDPLVFGNDYIAQVKNLVNSIEALRLLNDRLSQDSTLITRYFANPNARTDIIASDFTAAKNAMVQVLFTFDSGSPTQKAGLFGLL